MLQHTFSASENGTSMVYWYNSDGEGVDSGQWTQEV
jgi:hypothetical protein